MFLPSAAQPVVGQLEAQQAVAGLHLQLAVTVAEPLAVIAIGKAVGAVQGRIEVARQLPLRVVVTDQGGHRHAEDSGLAISRQIRRRPLVPAAAVGAVALLEAARDGDLLAVDEEGAVVAGVVVDADDAAAIDRRGGRQLDVAGPVAIPHGHLDQIVLGQQGGQLDLPQIAHRRGDLLGEVDPVAVGLHPGLAFVPLAETGGGRCVEHRLALEEALDDGGRVGGIEGEAVETGERLATGHGVEAELAPPAR